MGGWFRMAAVAACPVFAAAGAASAQLLSVKARAYFRALSRPAAASTS